MVDQVMETSSSSLDVDVVVLGGGISGLTIALSLARRGRSVVVLEKESAPGGSIRTLERDGFLFELGPNTVLSGGSHIEELIDAAGVAGERIEASPNAKTRAIVHRGRLVPLPSGPFSFLRSPLFSARAKLRLLREPFISRRADDNDESIASFVRRRLGTELLDKAVGPFVSGVYAGDPERLSTEHAVPRIAALERDHGSLIRGAFARRKGPAPRGRLISFRRGLHTLPRAVASILADAWHPSERATRIRTSGDGFVIDASTHAGDRVYTSRAVACALPPRAAFELLSPLSNPLGEALDELPCADVAVVSLGFRRADVSHPLAGFGFLSPAVEKRFVLGCLFPSSLFEGRAPEGHVALSTFVGGRLHPDRVTLSDDEIVREVCADLAPLLDLRGEPVISHVARWRPAIPQYEIGHGERKKAAQRGELETPGLFLAGNALHGVSIPDCIRTAIAVAERIERHLETSVARA